MVGITDKAPKKCWVEQPIVNVNEVTAKGGSLSSWCNDWAPSKELKCGLNNLYELYTMKHSSSTYIASTSVVMQKAECIVYKPATNKTLICTRHQSLRFQEKQNVAVLQTRRLQNKVALEVEDRVSRGAVFSNELWTEFLERRRARNAKPVLEPDATKRRVVPKLDMGPYYGAFYVNVLVPGVLREFYTTSMQL